MISREHREQLRAGAFPPIQAIIAQLDPVCKLRAQDYVDPYLIIETDGYQIAVVPPYGGVKNPKGHSLHLQHLPGFSYAKLTPDTVKLLRLLRAGARFTASPVAGLTAVADGFTTPEDPYHYTQIVTIANDVIQFERRYRYDNHPARMDIPPKVVDLLAICADHLWMEPGNIGG